jgi:CRISPR type III-A-associated protein Csm2
LETRLYDELAEEQAKAMPDERNRKINSSQLRRFYGEIKTLHRQYDAATRGETREQKDELYSRTFEPRFRMIRSKVAYAGRRSGQAGVPKEFATMLERGIQQTRPGQSADFEKFVTHLEAVVGFMYVKGRVSS